MAKSSCKPRLGWLTLVVVFLLNSHYDQPFLALAGETNDDGASQHFASVNDQKAGLRGQGMEATLGEAATDADLSTIQSVTGEDKNSAALNEDEVDVKDQPVLGKYHFRGTRRARAACRIVATVLVLAIIGRLLVPSQRAALREGTARLQRLEALVPVAEKLCATVGTPRSHELFSAVETLLPGIRQALVEAEAKLKEEGRVRFPVFGKPYQETMSCIQDIANQTSKTITALHKHARQELIKSKKIDGNKHSGVGSFKNELERLMGADYAKAFITSAESQEALVDEIVQAYKEVVFRSNARPVFANHRDGHLLIETIQDLEVAERLANARDTAQKFTERLENEASKLLSRAKDQIIRGPQGASKTLLTAVSAQLEEIAKHAQSMIEKSFDWQDSLDRDYSESLQRTSHCMKVSGTFFQLKLKLAGVVEAAAQTCKQLREEVKSQDTTEGLFKRLMLAIDEDSKACNALENLIGNRANFFLSGLLDNDVAKSVKTINALAAKDATPRTARAKFIAGKKMAIANDLEALEDTESLSTIAETAARLRKAAHLVQAAAYEGVVPPA
ncbi:hypothetical protein Emed_004597 [Eimeria media]